MKAVRVQPKVRNAAYDFDSGILLYLLDRAASLIGLTLWHRLHLFKDGSRV